MTAGTWGAIRGKVAAVVAIVVAAALIWLLAPVLTPFAIGAGLAYICNPLVLRLERFGVRRTLAIVAVFLRVALVIALLVLVLVPVLQRQVVDLIRHLPRYIEWVQQKILPLLGHLSENYEIFDPESIKSLLGEHWRDAGGIASATLKQIFSSGSALLVLGLNLLLVPVIMFYLLRDWSRMLEWIGEQIPRRHVATVEALARETDRVLGQFFRGQFLVMLALGLIYVVGLWLMGLNLALVIGVIAGLISFVPYLGVIVGLLLSSIAVLVQTGDAWQLIWIAIIFGFGQIMEQVVFQPLLVGDAIGLHPVWVIFAVLAGGQLFGFIGVLLALPAAAAIAVLVRHCGRVWRGSGLYLDET